MPKPIATLTLENARIELHQRSAEVYELCRRDRDDAPPQWKLQLSTHYYYATLSLRALEGDVVVEGDGFHCKDDSVRTFRWRVTLDGVTPHHANPSKSNGS